VQFELPSDPHRSAHAEGEWLVAGGRRVLLRLVRNRRARRYVLRLSADGSVRLTIPRGGSASEGRRFAERNAGWLERQLARQATQQSRPTDWRLGTEILFRGETVRLESGVNGEGGVVRFGSEALRVADLGGDLRLAVERHLRGLAERELAARVMELAAMHQLPVRRVMVRDQRSRWGSCSKRGTVSLNWRLIQAPLFVRDYLVLHELAHFKEMNHSRRFWAEVAQLCPDYAVAERWLKQHSKLLR
jgi:predicted metal-dependent hydrolase